MAITSEKDKDDDFDQDQKKIFAVKKKKLILTISITVFVIAVIVGMSLAIIFTTENAKYYEVDNRIDCLPWMRNQKRSNIEAECAKISYCKFSYVKSDVPYCFVFDKEQIKVKIGAETSTPLGKSFPIEYKSQTDGQIVNLKLDFEFLEDSALRFKIYRPDVKEYETPFPKVNKPTTRAQNPKYEVVINGSSFKIIRTSTNKVL